MGRLLQEDVQMALDRHTGKEFCDAHKGMAEYLHFHERLDRITCARFRCQYFIKYGCLPPEPPIQQSAAGPLTSMDYVV